MPKAKLTWLFLAMLALAALSPSCKKSENIEEKTKTEAETENGEKGEEEMAHQVWMSSFTPWELDRLEEWVEMRENLDVVCVFIDAIANASGEDLSRFADMLKKTGLKVSVECAGICDWYANSHTPGSDDFAYNSVYGDGGEFTRLKKLINLGVKIDYLNIDHGILRGTNPGDGSEVRMSPKEAAQQLFAAMKYWRKEFPGIKFNYIVNFPNHGWKGGFAYNYQWGSEFFCGDFYEVFELICAQNDESDVKMNAIVADFPYNYATGKMPTTFAKKVFDAKSYDWIGRIMDLEAESKAAGMKFGLIFNCDIAGYGRKASAEKYCADTLEYVDLYTSRGGDPDYFISESWYFLPDGTHIPALLPESAADTMTALTRQIAKKAKNSK